MEKTEPPIAEKLVGAMEVHSAEAVYRKSSLAVLAMSCDPEKMDSVYWPVGRLGFSHTKLEV
jgi:hypothetical protein